MFQKNTLQGCIYVGDDGDPSKAPAPLRHRKGHQCILPTAVSMQEAELARLLQTHAYWTTSQREYLDRVKSKIVGRQTSLPSMSAFGNNFYDKRAIGAWDAYRRCSMLEPLVADVLQKGVSGDFLEAGVFRGGTALLEAMIIADSGQARPLHLFDSFEGMPETTDGLDRFQKGDFNSTSAGKVAEILTPYPFVTMHVGFIPQTFRQFDPGPIAWAHVDVDIYQAVKDSIEFIYPRLVQGGFMVFDDYGFPSCPGARRAVDEAFFDRPEVPICLPTGQALVVKL